MEKWFQAADRDDVDFIYKNLSTFVSTIDANGNTALIRAAYSGSPRVCQLLQRELGYQNALGRTALMQAVFSDRFTYLYDVLKYEQKLQDNKGQTALMMAAANGRSSAAQLLLDECSIIDYKQRTALMLAAAAGHIDCVKLLQTKEAKRQDGSGNTALILAAHAGYLSIVMELADSEAGVRNYSGDNARQVAERAGHSTIVGVLERLERGPAVGTVQNSETIAPNMSLEVTKIQPQPEPLEPKASEPRLLKYEPKMPPKFEPKFDSEPQSHQSWATLESLGELRYEIYQQLATLSVKQQPNTFNEQILDQFHQLQYEVTRQLQSIALKQSYIGVDSIRAQTAADETQMVKQDLNRITIEIEQLKEGRNVKQLKDEVYSLKQRITELEQAQLQSQPKLSFGYEAMNMQQLQNQVYILQQNLHSLTMAVYKTPELKERQNLHELTAVVESLYLEYARTKAQNVDARLNNLEQAVQKLFGVWK